MNRKVITARSPEELEKKLNSLPTARAMAYRWKVETMSLDREYVVHSCGEADEEMNFAGMVWTVIVIEEPIQEYV